MKRGVRKEKPYRFASNVIFFLNVFIAFMIITGAWVLVETAFGKTVMIFGFFMLSISVVLKIVRMW